MRPLFVPRAARGGVAFCFLLSTLVSAQEVPTISVNVKVVNVLATVRDKKGKIVNTLGKDDFVLDENGRPQTIKYFTRETDLPLTLGLLVDTSLSQMQVIDEEKNASGAFVDDVLRADKDSAFLIHFDEEVELLQDVTSSPLKVSQALQELQVSRPNFDRRSGGQDPQPGGGRGRGGGHHFNAGTLLYDSIFLASDELMQKQKGRKAIVILTDGVDHGSKMTMDRAIESAQRADTMVYTIYFTGREGGGSGWERSGGMGGGWPGGGRHGGGWPGGGGGWPGGGGGWPGGGRNGGGGYPQPHENADGKKVLERISRETGGRMFGVGKKESITQIYADIQDELRNQYNLGFTSDIKDASVDYRHLKVTTKQKDLTVQAREGYYASKQLDSKPVQGQ